MALFAGKVGFDLGDVEIRPGDFANLIAEKKYHGDVTRLVRRNQNAQQVNDNLAMNLQISIVADTFAFEHAFAIAYVEYGGKLWKVESADDTQKPRIALTIGGVYNGPTPESAG